MYTGKDFISLCIPQIESLNKNVSDSTKELRSEIVAKRAETLDSKAPSNSVTPEVSTSESNAH